MSAAGAPRTIRAALALVAAATAALGCQADPMHEVHDFGDNPGGLRMFEKDPGGEAKGLVVMLHGCTEDHDVARRSGLLALADPNDLAVVAPEQAAVNNPQLCFDWFLADDVVRGRGELESIREMVSAASVREGLPVVVAGLSAGAVMAVAFAAAYPDVVTGVASFAGGPYGCATSLADAASCMAGAPDHTRAQWRALLDDAGAPAAGLDVGAGERPVLIMQGTDDPVVTPKSAAALVLQWSDDDEPTATTSAESDKGAVTIDDFGPVRRVTLDGVGHALPVDAAAGCGEAGPFLEDDGLCAVGAALEFFGLAE